MTDGTYTVTATATDAAANVSNASAGFPLVVDTTAPAAPVVVSSTPGSPSNTATPVVAGTSEANATITVSDGTSTIGTTTANGSGNWSVTVASMTDGTYTVTATATDAAANVSNASAGFALVVDTTAPTVPSNLNATTPTSVAPALTWNPSTDVTTSVATYKVWRDDGSGPSVIGTTANTNYTDSSLTIGGTFTYCLSAVDTVGNESAVSAGFPVAYSIPLPSNILTVGPNGTYATIAAAITAAAGLAPTANAVIKVESGNYEEFSAVGTNLPQSTRVMADVGAVVVIAPNNGPVSISQVAWTQSFEMVGVDIAVGGFVGSAISMIACDGTVQMRDGNFNSPTGVATVSMVGCGQAAFSNVVCNERFSVVFNSVVAMNNVRGSDLTVTNSSMAMGFGMQFTHGSQDVTSSITNYTGEACNLTITPRFATQNQAVSIDLVAGASNAGQPWVLSASASPMLHWSNNPVSVGSPLILGASLIANANVAVVASRTTDGVGNDSLAVLAFSDPYFFGLPLVFQGIVLDATSSDYHMTTAATYIQLP